LKLCICYSGKSRNGGCSPEDPLVKGFMTSLNDVALSDIQLLVQNGAQLEGSKEFAKNFNQTQHSTAAYDSFTAETVENGCKFGNTAATLCFESRWLAGKGVLIIQDLSQRRIEKHARTSKI
jgi:phosphoribosylamine--glycine ligase